MQTLNDLCCICLREENILVRLCKRNCSQLGIRRFLHHKNAIIRVVCNENFSHIKSYTTLQKAVKPHLFDDECIQLQIQYNDKTKRGGNCLEYLTGHKLIDRIQHFSVLCIPESMVDTVYAIFRECQQLVVLGLEMGQGLLAIMVLCMALKILPKLRVVVASFDWLCMPNLNTVDKDNLLKLRCLGMNSDPEPKDLKPWIQFLASLKNVKVLYLHSLYHVKEFIENCNNVLALRYLELSMGQSDNQTIKFTCSNMMMRALISLDIRYVRVFWDDIARACPSLTVLRVYSSRVVMYDYGRTETLYLKSLKLDAIIIEWTKGFEQSSVLQEITASALCNLKLVLKSKEETLFEEVGRWIINPKLLVNCNVRLKFRGAKITFRTPRVGRIRIFLWNCMRLVCLRRHKMKYH